MHQPVLPKEVIHYLNPQKGKIYIDCTLGTGGHSLEILKLIKDEGTLIGIEQDKSVLEIAKERLSGFDNCFLFHANYLDLESILESLKIDKITGGIFLDLGINSIQLNSPERGFSFNNKGPLDMRFNQQQVKTAEDILKTYPEHKLAQIIYKYGEERYSRKIAKKIVQKRVKKESISSTLELASIVRACYPPLKHFKIHPATRTFQALRIEVNKELENLEKLLCFVPELLCEKSRLCVISFHSLEDRIVKNFLRNRKDFRILTKKPVVPSWSEIKENSRARSAKLRAAEKNENRFKFIT